MANPSPTGRWAWIWVFALAGLSGIGLLAAAGWNLDHDFVLFGVSGVFQLTRKEWGSFGRELLGYVFGGAGAAALCALYLRRRHGASVWRTFAVLLGSFSVGWGAVVFAAGRYVPFHRDLAVLVWVGLAAASVAAFFYAAFALASETGHRETQSLEAKVSPSRRAWAKAWPVLAVTLAVAYVITAGALSVLRHNAFGSDLHDLGLYDQMLWNTLRGQPFHCTLWQITPQAGVAGGYDLEVYGYNFLAEHCMPVLLLLAPVYALWQDPRNLLLVQTLALGAAGLVLYRLAARMLVSRALGCLFLFAFLMNPLVQQTNLKDFHADAFEPVFFFLAVGGLVERRLWLYWLGLVLFLSCKEDVSLTVPALGVFLIWRERRGWLGVATLALGALWYAVAVKGLMEGWMRHGEPLRQLYRYHHLVPAGEEESVSGIVRTLVLNPFYVAYVLFEPGRLVSVLRLFLPVALLPLCAFSTVLFVLPPLASNLLSNWDTQYRLDLHYSIAILGPLYVAAVCGARNWLHPDRAHERFFPAPDEGLAKRETAPGARPRRRAAAMTAFILLAVGLLAYRYGRFPGGDRFDAEDYEVTAHHRLAQRFIERLPADAAVSAHSPIGAHLTGRERIYVFPEIQDADWVIVDTHDHHWPFAWRESFEEHVRRLLSEGQWGVVGSYEDGYLLLKKGADASQNGAVLERLDFKQYK